MKPILYSFRRCPYAIRARLAIRVSGIAVELREVVLKNKPESLLQSSPKGTVPVLQLPDGDVIDESFDIMVWALNLNDPEHWLRPGDEMLHLIERNDGRFKTALDRYKYADRYPDNSREYYRRQGEEFLAELNTRLELQRCLMGDHLSIVDMAIFPFVRQFAQVDKAWFDSSPYQSLKTWLTVLLASPLFHSVMSKYSPWKAGAPEVIF